MAHLKRIYDGKYWDISFLPKSWVLGIGLDWIPCLDERTLIMTFLCFEVGIGPRREYIQGD